MGFNLFRLKEKKDQEFVLGNLDNYTDIMSDFEDK